VRRVLAARTAELLQLELPLRLGTVLRRRIIAALAGATFHLNNRSHKISLLNHFRDDTGTYRVSAFANGKS